MKENVIALIDMGSNSIQLAIYNINNDHKYYHEIKRIKVAARLINYLDEQRKVTKEGINLIIATLKDFERFIKSYDVSHVIGFATAVIRNCSNQDEVLGEIDTHTTFSFTVLSEYEEAYNGYLGVIHSMDIHSGITIDIGGGSTELTLFQNRKMLHYHSFPFGAVTLNEAFTKGEIVTTQQVTVLREYLFNHLKNLTWLEKTELPIIGIGGSAKNVSRMFQASSNIEQTIIKQKDINRIFTELSSLNISQRSKIKGLSKRRKDIIIPAVQSFAVLMEVVQSPYFIYCEKTVRDGMIYTHLTTN